jgi:hypothetical protein
VEVPSAERSRKRRRDDVVAKLVAGGTLTADQVKALGLSAALYELLEGKPV